MILKISGTSLLTSLCVLQYQDTQVFKSLFCLFLVTYYMLLFEFCQQNMSLFLKQEFLLSLMNHTQSNDNFLS